MGEDGVDADKIEVVYNWSYDDTPIDLENIAPEKILDLQMDHDKCNVVYAGNIGKMQNVELVARAAYEMRKDDSVHFYIIGDGTNKENVERIVSGLKNVTTLPMQPSKYAESIYAQADINVIPLMPGGIMTALPSKTATVLRAMKPIIFCIESDSLTYKAFSANNRIYCVDPTDCNGLIETIESEKNKSRIKKYNSAFPVLFSKNNAQKYVGIISGKKK